MEDFPGFMKKTANKIDSGSQSRGIEGYVYDGIDGSQMAFWTCHKGGESAKQVHSYDEYMLVVQGRYTLIIGGQSIPVTAGREYFIPKGLAHAGIFTSGTRTIHAFGGKRAKRAGE